MFKNILKSFSLKQTTGFLLLLIFLLANALILWKYVLNEEKASLSVSDRIVFIGGNPRSGTTLMRVLLDVHGSIYCGPETVILLPFMALSKKLNEQLPPNVLMVRTRITAKSLKEATANFILHVLKNRNKQEDKILCAKDPPILNYMDILVDLFPNSKFIFMVRDGRAVSFSWLGYRKLEYNFQNYLDLLKEWDDRNNITMTLCDRVGPSYCKMVKYENLVLNKELVLRDLMKFLELEWNDNMLNHENFMETDVELGRKEWSNSQVIKPIYYKDSSKKWAKEIEDYDENIVREEIPMLKFFGYV
ncbi:unnamed protein product [Brachionus calyciflorus]|uniref:Protein-tyrosine sulfotransferase n=1 Tax=Brachionus calyciflorus TaxID=104777 RepID=A0A813LZE7_9BILA|nr:unnamed protein product [Brachionus calyciflorus]